MQAELVPRFSFPSVDRDSLRAESRTGQSVRTAWISDVHLGTRASNSGALLLSGQRLECERICLDRVCACARHSAVSVWALCRPPPSYFREERERLTMRLSRSAWSR